MTKSCIKGTLSGSQILSTTLSKKPIGAENNLVALSKLFLSAPLTRETCSLQSYYTQVSQHVFTRAHNTIAHTGHRPSALLLPSTRAYAALTVAHRIRRKSSGFGYACWGEYATRPNLATVAATVHIFSASCPRRLRNKCCGSVQGMHPHYAMYAPT